MLSLSSLILPGLIALGVLSGIVVVDTQTVFLRSFTVPPSMVRLGYTPTVVEMRLAEGLKSLEREAKTRPEARRLALESQEGSLELVASYLGLTPLVRALQNTGGLIEFTVTGDIVEEGDQYALRVRIVHRDGNEASRTVRKPQRQVEELLQEAAHYIMLRIEPQILCAGLMRRYLESGVGSADDVLGCARGSVPTAQPDDRVWLHNLAGVAYFVKGDRAAAAEQFRWALFYDPGFSPTLLNVGVLFALDGRHEEAIKAFRAVFPNPTVNDSPQTYSGAYMEWGNSLIALGQPEEAQEKFAAAVHADPLFAPAYFRWAETLPQGPQRRELRQLGRIAEGRHVQIYTENLLGVVRQARAAPAAR